MKKTELGRLISGMKNATELYHCTSENKETPDYLYIALFEDREGNSLYNSMFENEPWGSEHEWYLEIDDPITAKFIYELCLKYFGVK